MGETKILREAERKLKKEEDGYCEKKRVEVDLRRSKGKVKWESERR